MKTQLAAYSKHHEEIFIVQGGAVSSSKYYYCIGREGDDSSAKSYSKRKRQHCRLHSTSCAPRSLAAYCALCDCCCLQPLLLLCAVLLCCCAVVAECGLRASNGLCAGCVACRVSLDILKRAPCIFYEGVIGLGDRVKQLDREKTSRFPGFVFFPPGKPAKKIGFRLEKPTKNRLSVHNKKH